MPAGTEAARHPAGLAAGPGLGPRGIARLIVSEWAHHPGRLAMALLAIALGVALALAVHLINASALAEFGQAVRSVNGQPDVALRPVAGSTFDEAHYPTIARHPQVTLASPVVEVETLALGADGKKRSLKVVGIDTLLIAPLSPALLPRPAAGQDRLAGLNPDLVFLNPAARALVGDAPALRVQSGAQTLSLAVGGTVAAEGPPLAVIDIAGAQAHFDRVGRLSRLDLRLAPGTDRATLLREISVGTPGATLRAAAPDEAEQRVSNLSRAYRVNLSVLALVALFVGGFLVFSVQALAVAKRVPQLALLGVIGMSARERWALVLTEAAAIGVVGSALGVALGTGLALLALRLLGGDLGSGMLGGAAPTLQWSTPAALTCAVLGLAAALAGGWQPARLAQRLSPVASLKGLGGESAGPARPWLSPALLALSAVLALLPPIEDLPLAAYASVALLLLGGIAGVPALIGWALGHTARDGQPQARHPIVLLALERARDQRQAATVAVAGVVASLALSVALTVMVASFRDSVSAWLGQVLPADVYARTANSSAQAESVYLEPAFVQAAAALPGVARVQGVRSVAMTLSTAATPIVLIARPLPDPAQDLPMLGALLAAPTDPADAALPAVYATEGFMVLHGARVGQRLALPLADGRSAAVWLRGVWRDYARQQGALAMADTDWQRLSGDRRINDLGLWLAPGADVAAVQTGLRTLAPTLEIATPAQIRAISLAIFDRSFAVTYWLQAVAIGIGLFGIAASFSAQVLARRRELGALRHLGFSRRQVLMLVGAEGAVWTAAGTLIGLGLGVLISAVLVFVVNPQSFHWTMELSLPWAKLAALAGAVMAAGTLTALLAGRAAAGRDLAMAVKEDW
jgi:putative ABC transport system permease protein